MKERVKDIPRICVCCQHRTGSTMLIRMLDAGGLAVDRSSTPVDEFTLKMYRQPAGLWTNDEAIEREEFVNSFKLSRPEKFAKVPSDYKFIFIGRPLEEINDSWGRVRDVWEELGGKGNYPIDTVIANSILQYNNWQDILVANPNLFLRIDFNDVIANTAEQLHRIALFVNVVGFVFDEVKAAEIFNYTLATERGD